MVVTVQMEGYWVVTMLVSFYMTTWYHNQRPKHEH